MVYVSNKKWPDFKEQLLPINSGLMLFDFQSEFACRIDRAGTVLDNWRSSSTDHSLKVLIKNGS
jgi:hypothetical protein